MRPCDHHYDDDRVGCPHPAPDGAETCLWHNQQISKAAPYVRQLIEQANQRSGGDFEEAQLAGLAWPDAHLAYARLARADLRDAQLPRADLTGADLRGVVFKRANLQGAKLTGAKLDGADLSQAHLGEADLRDAEMVGARFDGTILIGADLRNANLKDAEVVDLRWNQRTRFAGIRGLEARGGTSDADATQRYIAPVAIGDGAELLEPERTRVYRQSDATLTAPNATPTPTPGPQAVPAPIPGPDHTALKRANTRLRWALAAALLLAALGTAGVAVLALQPPPRPIGGGSSGGPVVVDPRGTGEPLDDQQRATYRAEIDRLAGELSQASSALDLANSRRQQEASRYETLLRDLEQARRLAELDASRLRTNQDEADDLRQQLELRTAEYRDLQARNLRLEQTAEILVEGVTRLERENAIFEQRSFEQLASGAQMAELEEQNQSMARELDAARRQLDRNENLRQELVDALQVAKNEMDRLAQAIQGTELESMLMSEDTSREPLLSLVRGEPVVLAGEYLVTLTVETGSSPEAVITNVTVQGPTGDPLPDISVVLYEGPEQPARKITWGFPDSDAQRAFASAASEVQMARFPTHARVVLAPARVGPPLLGRNLE